MSKYSLLVNILRSDLEKQYMDYYKKNGVTTVFTSFCKGTASKSMIDYLGIEENEKVMFQMLVARDNVQKIMNGLLTKMGIGLPGTGIAITVPLGSIAGTAGLKYLTEGQQNKTDEVKKMNEMSYALIIAIAEKGCTDLVMDAARGAGAGGGTVVHGKGTANEFTAKFFGVSIATEKEMIYIVSRKADKDKIMQAIVEKAGPATDAKAAVFSLPVDSVIGLANLTDPEEN